MALVAAQMFQKTCPLQPPYRCDVPTHNHRPDIGVIFRQRQSPLQLINARQEFLNRTPSGRPIRNQVRSNSACVHFPAVMFLATCFMLFTQVQIKPPTYYWGKIPSSPQKFMAFTVEILGNYNRVGPFKGTVSSMYPALTALCYVNR